MNIQLLLIRLTTGCGVTPRASDLFSGIVFKLLERLGKRNGKTRVVSIVPISFRYRRALAVCLSVQRNQ